MKRKYIKTCLAAVLSTSSMTEAGAAILLPNSIYEMTLDVGDSSIWIGDASGGNTYAMQDNFINDDAVNLAFGNDLGVIGNELGVIDGNAGVIRFVTDATGNDLSIASFQVDPIWLDNFDPDEAFFQSAGSLPNASMSGTIDNLGNMSLDVTGRLALHTALLQTIGVQPFNIDSNAGAYDLFTTGMACNLVNCVTGSVVTASAVPNEFTVTLVNAGEFGAEWGAALAGASYNEVWSSQNTITLIGPASTVPIPAAVWLFSSGLLGLVGVARHKKS